MQEETYQDHNPELGFWNHLQNKYGELELFAYWKVKNILH